MKFRVITAMYNVEEWIEENIQSLKEQTFSDFQTVLVDDLSTDDTFKIVQTSIQGDDRFLLIVNKEKKYKTRNVVEAIDAARPDDEDVIVIVDGDDRLAHPDVLKNLEGIYRRQDCWMTYGSIGDSQGVRHKACVPYKKSIISSNRFRQERWIVYPLRTFKYKLWRKLNMDIFQITATEVKQALTRALLKLQFRRWYHWKDIKTEDLHDVSGKYIRRADDKAFSYPMLEMSGERAYFIEELLYITHWERTPYKGPDQNYGKGKSETWHTRLIRDILPHKEPYERLDHL
jgi:glycosyltransferase involved in cell wall biosynthesis